MFDPNGAGKGEERRERPQEHGPIEVREVGMSGSPGAETTVVGQGARLEGSVVSAGSLRVDGQVKGKVLAEGDVLLSPQSQVEADIEAQNVTVAGRFKGSITVKGRALLTRDTPSGAPLRESPNGTSRARPSGRGRGEDGTVGSPARPQGHP